MASKLSAKSAITSPADTDLIGVSTPGVDTFKFTWANLRARVAAALKSGGSDAIKLDDLGTPDDNTDLDATGSAHGLMPKLAVTKLAGIEESADVTDKENVAAAIVSAVSKSTPVDADSIGIIDSETGNVLKETTFAQFKAFLKTYFDTLYTTAAAAIGAVKAGFTLDENAGITIDPALTADGNYVGILLIQGTAGAALAFGKLCYKDPTDGRWELVDANAAAAADGDARGELGFCVLAAAADGDPTKILKIGYIRADSLFPTLTVGGQVFASETAGAITMTAPTTEDAVQRVVGQGYTADVLAVNISPDHQIAAA